MKGTRLTTRRTISVRGSSNGVNVVGMQNRASYFGAGFGHGGCFGVAQTAMFLVMAWGIDLFVDGPALVALKSGFRI